MCTCRHDVLSCAHSYFSSYVLLLANTMIGVHDYIQGLGSIRTTSTVALYMLLVLVKCNKKPTRNFSNLPVLQSCIA